MATPLYQECLIAARSEVPNASALDAALLRPGRIDYRLYMGEAEEAQKAELYRRFFPGATHHEAVRFVMSRPKETMAAFQGELLMLMAQDESQDADRIPA